MTIAAEADLARVRLARDSKSLSPQRLEFNTSGEILAIAVEVLAGHIAAAKGDYRTATSHLRKAVELEDALVYGEPPEWSVPVRQELGRVLVSAGRYAEAEQVFRDDLQRFPGNTWSLEGLQRAADERERAQKAGMDPMQAAAAADPWVRRPLPR